MIKERDPLEEAIELTSGDRQKAYGHPLYNFNQTAALWQAYMGFEFTAEDVAMMMVLVKVARQSHLYKHDNLVDIAGYIRTIHMIQEERVRLAEIGEKVKDAY